MTDPVRTVGPALKLKTGPSIAPVTLEEAKRWARVDHADDDTIIQSLIDGATKYFENILGRAFIEQEWYVYYDAFPDEDLQIPLGDVISVSEVAYMDPTLFTYSAWAGTNYYLDNLKADGWIVAIDSWPTSIAERSNAVRITFKAGYGSAAATVPQPIRSAICMLVVMHYDDPTGVDYEQPFDGLPLAIRSMISPFRRMFV